jgi:flagellin
MALTVNTNIAAMNAYRSLSVTDGQMSKSLEKLSSGYRINRAADDAAGLAISEGLRSQIGGIKMAVRNTQDGISVVQTAEGALTETHSILQRMRDLSVQAANTASLNDSAKKNIQTEVTQLKSELDRISTTTQFNGSKLLDGSYTGKVFQVGANAGETITIGVGTSMSSTGLKVNGVDVAATASNAASAVVSTSAAAATAAVLTINTAATGAGDITGASASYSKLNGTVSYGGKSLDLSSIAYASTDDTAAEQLLVLNAAARTAFGFAGSVSAFATPTSASITFTAPELAGAGANAQRLADVSPAFGQASGASEAIALLDTAISTVSTVRSNLGALQNRFEHTINNLNVAAENLSASESRIRDTDMAQEMTNFTRTQILSQAGTAMLAQANQVPQGILKLLG